MTKIKFVSMFLAYVFTIQLAHSSQFPRNNTPTENMKLIQIAGTHPGRQAASPEKAKEFVNSVGQQVISIIKASQNGRINKDDDFKALLKKYFNLPRIGRFALGRHWKHATPEEQKEYLQLFESAVVKTYASQFSEYTNENLEVTGARPNAEHGITVLSRVIRPGHPPLKVNWEIRVEKDGAMKIEDLIVNGVSMRITQRSEYMAVIQKNNGEVSGLIAALRNQITRLKF